MDNLGIVFALLGAVASALMAGRFSCRSRYDRRGRRRCSYRGPFKVR